MSQIDLYRTAAQNKLRFPSSKGQLSVEQLFDLPLDSEKYDSLNGLAKAAYLEAKGDGEISFVTSSKGKSKAVKDAELRLEILKDIIAAKELENALKLQQKQNREAREARIAALLDAQSKLEAKAIEAMTPEQIAAELTKLAAE